MIEIPAFQNKADLFRWLKTNKHLILTAKKSVVKFADPIEFGIASITAKGFVQKAEANPELLNLAEFPVKVVINTTNLMDSYGDVHIPGLWSKSLSESRGMYLLQEHQMKFDKVISDRVTPSCKMMPWAELGFPWPGNTEALIFDCTIEKERNPYMAEQYAKARVNNHSVGMRYIKIALAMNSESKWDAEEKAIWDQYIGQVVNRAEAEDQGYFFAVTEAKAIEGSAVLAGANFATPTISVGKDIALTEAAEGTPAEPLFGLKFLSNN